MFSSLQEHSKAVSSAEIQLHDLTHELNDARAHLTHVEIRLNAAKQRLRTEFKGKALEQQGLEAAARAKKALSLFRERLLASKANWLSEMITAEFRQLLRKKKMISRVVVNPESYAVSIEDSTGHVFLSATCGAHNVLHLSSIRQSWIARAMREIFTPRLLH